MPTNAPHGYGPGRVSRIDGIEILLLLDVHGLS